MDFEAEFSNAYPVPNVQDTRTGYTYPILFAKVSHFIMTPTDNKVMVQFNCYSSPDCDTEPVTTAGVPIEAGDAAENIMKGCWTAAMGMMQEELARIASANSASAEDTEVESEDEALEDTVE